MADDYPLSANHSQNLVLADDDVLDLVDLDLRAGVLADRTRSPTFTSRESSSRPRRAGRPPDTDNLPLQRFFPMAVIGDDDAIA